MKVIKKIQEMQEEARVLRQEGKSIALVPTMGYFHEGHLALMRKAREVADAIVVSIFVNPAQFGPTEDFASYPRDFERDAQLAEKEGTELIFAPEVEEMYPAGFRTYVSVEEWGERLCGRSRPTHFRGVCTVVLKLFTIVQPDFAVFGWKDAQQFIILRRMVEDLNLPIKMIGVATVREEDELAMSSRNVYLSPEERTQALSLQQALKRARELFAKGQRNSESIIAEMRDLIEQNPAVRIDYIEIVSQSSLEPLKEIKAGDTLIAIAAWVGKARLIDNIRL